MSNVWRVAVCVVVPDALGDTEYMHPEPRCYVRDVSDEGGPEFTPLRALAARYFDQAQAHRVAELVRDTGKVGAGEKVVVYRARLPR